MQDAKQEINSKKLSHWIDNPKEDETLTELLNNKEMQEKYLRYEMIKDAIKSEVNQFNQLDISASVLNKIEKEKLSYKKLKEIKNKEKIKMKEESKKKEVIELVKKTSLFLIIFSLILGVILGISSLFLANQNSPDEIIKTNISATPSSLETKYDKLNQGKVENTFRKKSIYRTIETI